MKTPLQISLQRAAGGRLTLPVDAEEYTAREFKRRITRICACSACAMMLCIFGIFVWAGFFPVIHRGVLTNPPTDFGLKLFVFIVAIPLVLGLILWSLMRGTTPKIAESEGHPLHYRATAEGLTVRAADGREISAPWPEVRLQNSAEMYFKPGVTALTRLDFLIGERPITLQVTRLKRRGSRMLLRALAKHWLATTGGE